MAKRQLAMRWVSIFRKGTKRTVSSIALDDATHTHGGRAFEEGTCDNGVGPRDGITATGDGKDSVVDTLNNLADASLDARVIAKVGDVLATLADDDTGFLGRHNGSESELGLGIFLVRLRGGFTIRSKALVHLEVIERIDEISAVGGEVILRSRHCSYEAERMRGGEDEETVRMADAVGWPRSQGQSASRRSGEESRGAKA